MTYYFNEEEFNAWKNEMVENRRKEMEERGEDISNFWSNAFCEFIEEGRKQFFEEVMEGVDYFKDMYEDEENYPDCESIIEGLRSLLSNGDIRDDEYDYIMENWDNLIIECSFGH